MTSRDLDVDAILSGVHDEVGPDHRSGLVALTGRPNVGKSTLLNHLLGTKVAIVTPVPGTTRNTIRGVLTTGSEQIAFVDTPGLAKPQTLLGQRLNHLVRDTWSSVNAVVFIVDIAAGIGTGDRFLAAQLAQIGTPVIAVANKIDEVSDKSALLPALQSLDALAPDGQPFVAIVPVSALTGENTDELLRVVTQQLPHGPRLFPPDAVSDQLERQLAAEVIREKLIERAREELPHSIAVVVDEVVPDEHRDDLLRIDAVIYVERDSQKGIVIGRGGDNLKAAATSAREELEKLLGARIHLTTHVKVAKEWQRDPKQLGRLGY
ncbi:MAG: GTPase Era [Nitriliruptoraceae bacterium]